jgi:hypothetical protein
LGKYALLAAIEAGIALGYLILKVIISM